MIERRVVSSNTVRSHVLAPLAAAGGDKHVGDRRENPTCFIRKRELVEFNSNSARNLP